MAAALFRKTSRVSTASIEERLAKAKERLLADHATNPLETPQPEARVAAPRSESGASKP